MSITIDDAYYGNLDDDSYEDDIRISLTLVVSNWYYYTDIDLYIGIELPSGIEFWFIAEFTVYKTTYSGYITIDFDLLNTATESGWYTASAVGFANNERVSIMDTLIFDPPGSTDGADPKGYYSIAS